MGEGHGHGHERGAASQRRLALTLVLTSTYMVAEVVGGLASGSLALLADAGHMLSDSAALALSLFALWIARRPPTPQRTFGHYRAEVLAALVNGAALLAIAAGIVHEAWGRAFAPPAVQGGVVLGVGLGGLAVNLVALWILEGARHESLNVRGAWLHVVTDALGSVAALAAGALILAFGWHWADPLASALICALIVFSAWHLLRDVVNVLMEGVPGHIDLDEVRAALATTPGVTGVHDLHVWTITTGVEALSGHVVVADDRATGPLLRALRETLHDRFGLHHVTLQLEPEGFDEPSLPI